MAVADRISGIITRSPAKPGVQGVSISISLSPVPFLVAGGAQHLASQGVWLLL